MASVVTIQRTIRISAAHQLSLPYESKCNRVHGHNYRIQVWLTGTTNDDGMVMDFFHIKKEIMRLDHQNLNSFFTPSTAEVMATYLLGRMRQVCQDNVSNIRIRVWETDNAYAECQEQS